MKRIILIMFCYVTVISAQDMNRFIDVNGRAEIMAEADYVQFKINIKTVSEKLKESKESNNKAVDELVSIFDDVKIQKDDYECSPIQFGKEYSYTRDKRELLGYYSRVSVEVKLKNLDYYYSFIDMLSNNNLFEISSSNYGITDIQKYNKQATIDAAKAAKEKAEYIAESMGLKIGKIIQLTELNSYQTQPTHLNKVSAMGAGREEISGKVSISRSINMRAELIDK